MSDKSPKEKKRLSSIFKKKEKDSSSNSSTSSSSSSKTEFSNATHDIVKADFIIEFEKVTNMSSKLEGKKVYISWKRGNKPGNYGKTQKNPILKDLSVSWNEQIKIHTTLYKKKSSSLSSLSSTPIPSSLLSLTASSDFEPKELAISVKESKNVGIDSSLHKMVLNLSEFAGHNTKVSRGFFISKSKGDKGPQLFLKINTTWSKINNKRLTKASSSSSSTSSNSEDSSGAIIITPAENINNTPNSKKITIGDEEYNLQTAMDVTEVEEKTDLDFSDEEDEVDFEQEEANQVDPDREREREKEREAQREKERERMTIKPNNQELSVNNNKEIENDEKKGGQWRTGQSKTGSLVPPSSSVPTSSSMINLSLPGQFDEKEVQKDVQQKDSKKDPSRSSSKGLSRTASDISMREKREKEKGTEKEKEKDKKTREKEREREKGTEKERGTEKDRGIEKERGTEKEKSKKDHLLSAFRKKDSSAPPSPQVPAHSTQGGPPSPNSSSSSLHQQSSQSSSPTSKKDKVRIEFQLHFQTFDNLSVRYQNHFLFVEIKKLSKKNILAPSLSLSSSLSSSLSDSDPIPYIGPSASVTLSQSLSFELPLTILSSSSSSQPLFSATKYNFSSRTTKVQKKEIVFFLKEFQQNNNNNNKDNVAPLMKKANTIGKCSVDVSQLFLECLEAAERQYSDNRDQNNEHNNNNQDNNGAVTKLLYFGPSPNDPFVVVQFSLPPSSRPPPRPVSAPIPSPSSSTQINIGTERESRDRTEKDGERSKFVQREPSPSKFPSSPLTTSTPALKIGSHIQQRNNSSGSSSSKNTESIPTITTLSATSSSSSNSSSSSSSMGSGENESVIKSLRDQISQLQKENTSLLQELQLVKQREALLMLENNSNPINQDEMDQLTSSLRHRSNIKSSATSPVVALDEGGGDLAVIIREQQKLIENMKVIGVVVTVFYLFTIRLIFYYFIQI